MKISSPKKTPVAHAVVPKKTSKILPSLLRKTKQNTPKLFAKKAAGGPPKTFLIPEGANEKVSDITNPKYEENLEGREIHTSNIAETETADLSSLSSSTASLHKRILKRNIVEPEEPNPLPPPSVQHVTEKHNMSLSKNIQLSAPSPVTLQRVVVNANTNTNNNNNTAAAGLEEQTGATIVGPKDVAVANAIPVVPATSLIVKGYQKIGTKRGNPKFVQAVTTATSGNSNSDAATMEHKMILSPAATSATVIASQQSKDEDDSSVKQKTKTQPPPQQHLGFEQVKALLEFVGKKAMDPQQQKDDPAGDEDELRESTREAIPHVLATASSTIVTAEQAEEGSSAYRLQKNKSSDPTTDDMAIRTSKSREKLEPEQVKELFEFAGRKAMLSVMGIPVVRQQGSLYDSDSIGIPVVQNMGSLHDADALIVEPAYSFSANTSVSSRFRQEPPEQKHEANSSTWEADDKGGHLKAFSLAPSLLSSPPPPPPPPPPVMTVTTRSDLEDEPSSTLRKKSRSSLSPTAAAASRSHYSRLSNIPVDGLVQEEIDQTHDSRPSNMSELSALLKMARSSSPHSQATNLSKSYSTMGELSKMLKMSKSVSPSQATGTSPSSKTRTTMGEVSSFLKLSSSKPSKDESSRLQGSVSPMGELSKLLYLSHSASPKSVPSRKHAKHRDSFDSLEEEMQQNYSFQASKNEASKEENEYTLSRSAFSAALSRASKSDLHSMRIEPDTRYLTSQSRPNNLPTPRSHPPSQHRIRGLDPDVAPVRVPVDAPVIIGPTIRELDETAYEQEYFDQDFTDGWLQDSDEDKENLASGDDEKLGLRLNPDGTVEVANDPFDEHEETFADGNDENLDDVQESYVEEELNKKTRNATSASQKSFESSNVLFPQSLSQILLPKSVSRDSFHPTGVPEKKLRTNPFESFSDEDEQKDSKILPLHTNNPFTESSSSSSLKHSEVPTTLPKSRTTTSSKTPSRKKAGMKIQKQSSDPSPLKEKNDGRLIAKNAVQSSEEKSKAKKAPGTLVREKVALFENANSASRGFSTSGGLKKCLSLSSGDQHSSEEKDKYRMEKKQIHRSQSSVGTDTQGIALPREIDMDYDLYVSDLDQSLRNFPVKQVNAIAIDNISGLDPTLTHDGQDTITTRESLSKDALECYEPEVAKSSLTLDRKQSKTIPETHGPISKNLADSLTDTFSLTQQGTLDETIAMEALFNPCTSIPCTEMLRHIPMGEGDFTQKRITFDKHGHTTSLDHPTETREAATFSERKGTFNRLPDETPRISNEGRSLPDADGFKCRTSSFTAGALHASSQPGTKKKEKRNVRAPRNSFVDKNKHFFSDNDSDSEWMPVQQAPFPPNRQLDEAHSPNITVAESEEFDNQIDRYETFEEHSVKMQENRLCPINEASDIVGSSFLSRLLAFGHDAAGLSPASKKELESKLEVLSPTSRDLLKKSMQTALIDKYASSAEISETSTNANDFNEMTQMTKTSRASADSNRDDLTGPDSFSMKNRSQFSEDDSVENGMKSKKTFSDRNDHNDSKSNQSSNEGVEVRLLRSFSFSSSISDVVAIAAKDDIGRDIRISLENMTKASMSKLERFLESATHSFSETKTMKSQKSELAQKGSSEELLVFSGNDIMQSTNTQDDEVSSTSMQLTAALQSKCNINSETASKDSSILRHLRNYIKKANKQNIDLEMLQLFVGDSKSNKACDGATKKDSLTAMTSDELRQLLQDGLRKSRSKSLCPSDELLGPSGMTPNLDKVLTSQSTISTASKTQDLSHSNEGSMIIKPIGSHEAQNHLTENELIDLTGIGSFEDLINEDAVWLFDVSPKNLSADSRSEFENLMELAARKLGLVVDMENEQQRAELKEELDIEFDSILTYVSSQQERETCEDRYTETFAFDGGVPSETHQDDAELIVHDQEKAVHLLDQNVPTEASSVCGPSEDKYATHHDAGEALDELLFKICEGSESIFCGSGFEVIPLSKPGNAKSDVSVTDSHAKSKSSSGEKNSLKNGGDTVQNIANHVSTHRKETVLNTIDGEVFDFVEKYYRSRPDGLEEFRRKLESSIANHSDNSSGEGNSIVAQTCKKRSDTSVANNSEISSTDELSMVLVKMKRDILESKAGSLSGQSVRDSNKARVSGNNPQPTRQDFLDVLCTTAEDVICGTRTSLAPLNDTCDDERVGASLEKNFVSSDCSTDIPMQTFSGISRDLSMNGSKGSHQNAVSTLGSRDFSAHLHPLSSEILSHTPDTAYLDAQVLKQNHNFFDFKDHLQIPDLNAICSSVPSKLQEDTMGSDDENHSGYVDEMNNGLSSPRTCRNFSTDVEFHEDNPSHITFRARPKPEEFGTRARETSHAREFTPITTDGNDPIYVEQVSTNAAGHDEILESNRQDQTTIPRFPRPNPENLQFKDDFLVSNSRPTNMDESNVTLRLAPCPENYIPSGDTPRGKFSSSKFRTAIGKNLSETTIKAYPDKVKAESVYVVEENEYDANFRSRTDSLTSDCSNRLPLGAKNVEIVDEKSSQEIGSTIHSVSEPNDAPQNSPRPFSRQQPEDRTESDDPSSQDIGSRINTASEQSDDLLHKSPHQTKRDDQDIESCHSKSGESTLHVEDVEYGKNVANKAETIDKDAHERSNKMPNNKSEIGNCYSDQIAANSLNNPATISNTQFAASVDCVEEGEYHRFAEAGEADNTRKMVSPVASVDVVEESDKASHCAVTDEDMNKAQFGVSLKDVNDMGLPVEKTNHYLNGAGTTSAIPKQEDKCSITESESQGRKCEAFCGYKSGGSVYDLSTSSENFNTWERDILHSSKKNSKQSQLVNLPSRGQQDALLRADTFKSKSSQRASCREHINSNGDGRRPETPIFVECVAVADRKLVQDDNDSIITSREGSTYTSDRSSRTAETIRPVVTGYDAFEQKEIPLLVTTREKNPTKDSTDASMFHFSDHGTDIESRFARGSCDVVIESEGSGLPSVIPEADYKIALQTNTCTQEQGGRPLPVHSVDPSILRNDQTDTILGVLDDKAGAQFKPPKFPQTDEKESLVLKSANKDARTPGENKLASTYQCTQTNSTVDQKSSNDETDLNESVYTHKTSCQQDDSTRRSRTHESVPDSSNAHPYSKPLGHERLNSSEKPVTSLPPIDPPQTLLLSQSGKSKATSSPNSKSSFSKTPCETSWKEEPRIPTEISVTRRSLSAVQRGSGIHTDIPHEIELKTHRRARSLLQSVSGQLSALWMKDREKSPEQSENEMLESSPKSVNRKLPLPDYLTEEDEDEGADLLLALTRSETYSEANAPISHSASGDGSAMPAGQPHEVIHLENLAYADTDELGHYELSALQKQNKSYHDRVFERTKEAKRSAKETRNEQELHSSTKQENVIDVTKMGDSSRRFSDTSSSRIPNNERMVAVKSPIDSKVLFTAAKNKVESIPPLLSITSSDVEPVDVEELLQRYDQIVKNMVVLDEERLARVQAKKSFEFAEAEKARRDSAMSQRRSSSAQRASQRDVENHHLSLKRSASFGSLPAVASSSTESCTASEKVRGLRAQLESALKASEEVRDAQQRLGEEMSQFKHKIQEHRMHSPPASPRSKHYLSPREEQPGHHSSSSMSSSHNKSRPIDRLRERHEKLARRTSHSPRVGNGAESTVNSTSLIINSTGSSNSMHGSSSQRSYQSRQARPSSRFRSQDQSESIMMSIERVTSSSSTPLITNLLASFSSQEEGVDDGGDGGDRIPDVEGVDSDDLFMNYTGSDEDDDDLARTQQIESILSELRTAESLSPRAAATTTTKFTNF